MTKQEGVAAVDRALSILDAFRSAKGPLSLKELSGRTGLYKSTILRLLVSLEGFGYVRRLSEGGYVLGPKTAELAAKYQMSFNLGDHVQPVLDALVAQVNESASFYIAERGVRVCLFRSDANQVVRDHIRVGDALPLALGASGMALTHYAGGMPHQVRDEDLVFVSLGSRHPDMAAVAVPVFDVERKCIGALCISGPLSRFDSAAIQQHQGVLLEAAVDLSISLGAPLTAFVDRVQQPSHA